MTDDREVHVHLHVDADGDEQRNEQQASIGSDVPNAEGGMNAGAAQLSAHDLEEAAGPFLDEDMPADTTARNAGRAPDEVEQLTERGRPRSPDSGNEIRLKD